jgi:hypothetical protein
VSNTPPTGLSGASGAIGATTNAVVNDANTISTAAVAVIAAIAALDPSAAVVLAIVAAAVKLAPEAIQQVENLIAELKGQSGATASPLLPEVTNDTAALEQTLNTPLGGTATS